MNYCDRAGKVTHPSAQAAWKIIEIQESPRWRQTHKRRAAPGGTAYPCPYCGGWHLATAKKSDRRPVRQDLYGETRI